MAEHLPWFLFTLRFKRSFIIYHSAASIQMEKGMLKSEIVGGHVQIVQAATALLHFKAELRVERRGGQAKL